jgi:uncharacterized protein (DUF302 family)
MRPAVALLLALFALIGPARAGDEVVVATVSGSFDHVKENVGSAIEGKGLVISAVSNVSEMLDRTAADVGAKRKVYGQGEVFEFCSASVSRQIMEADPRNLAFCPFTIAVYTLAEQAGKVFVAYRRPPADKAFDPVRTLLQGIVAEATR